MQLRHRLCVTISLSLPPPPSTSVKKKNPSKDSFLGAAGRSESNAIRVSGLPLIPPSPTGGGRTNDGTISINQTGRHPEEATNDGEKLTRKRRTRAGTMPTASRSTRMVRTCRADDGIRRFPTTTTTTTTDDARGGRRHRRRRGHCPPPPPLLRPPSSPPRGGATEDRCSRMRIANRTGWRPPTPSFRPPS